MAESPTPSGAEMNELRQEAIRRAREMQARAQISPPRAAPEPPEPPAEGDPPRQESAPREPGPSEGPGIGGALDFLTKDTERTLILLLLLILMEEKSDSSLLFAMMYLLM